MDRAAIFYIDEQWLRGDDNPFGVRYDASMLPKGSVVAGFLKRQGNHIQEVVSPPHTNENQEKHWTQCLEEARQTLA
jgi:hypothetical protein